MSIPETQRDLLVYLDRITREIGSSKIRRDSTGLDCFTTAAIAESLAISRNLASQYLNELVRAGAVVKAGARPVHYFHRRALERYFQARIDRPSYPTIETLFAARGNADDLDFARAIGHEQSLAPCISQLSAALAYPPSGLPILLCGASGTGKTMLAQLALEYGKNAQILRPGARLVTVDCARHHTDTRELIENLHDSDGFTAQAQGGIVCLKDVDLLPSSAQEALANWAADAMSHFINASAITSDDASPLARFIFTTTHEITSPDVSQFARRIPMRATVPALCDRTQEEREELTLHFLKEEGRRMGVDILVSRGAFRCLAGASFEENVRGLRDCITNCCAEAYLGNSGDRLEIRTYQLPTDVLSGMPLNHNEDDSQLVDTTRSIQGQSDDRVSRALETVLEPYARYQANELDDKSLYEQTLRRARDFEDYLAFEQAFNRSKEQAYEHIANDVVASVNGLYSLELSRKSAHLIAQILCLQLYAPTSLSRWKNAHDREIIGLSGVVIRSNRFAATVTGQLVEELGRVLGIECDGFTTLILMSHVALSLNPSRRRQSLGIILSHGYSTATSIADAANRILHARVFEAIDMTYDQQVIDVIGPLQSILDRFSYLEETAILVDMGSLQDVYKSLGKTPGLSLGIINNASTGLAVEVGAGLLARRGVTEILKGAADTCRCSYKVIERAQLKDAIVFCAEGGLGAAEKIKELVSQSLDGETPVCLMACDYRQLSELGTKNAVFDKYAVRALIGADDPHIAGVPFISLEELVAGEGTAQIDRAFAHSLDEKQLARLHENLVKNMTLRNVVESITILNPNKLFAEIERAVERLQELTGDVIGPRITIGLYVHLCCLVERLVTRSPIETYADESTFASRHADFIDAFRSSFADISAHYHVEVPITEIAYAYDYVSSSHAPRTRADSHSILEEDDWN